MASLLNRVNQGISQQPAGGIQKPLIKKPVFEKPVFMKKEKVAVHHLSAGPSNSLRLEPKPDALSLKAQRTKRICAAQENVRTASKESGLVPVRNRPENVKDIYVEDVTNEALVVAYVEHIYSYLHQREKLRLNENYMQDMSINPRMRTILMDWLVSVAYKFGMCQDTLFLSVDIVDRFLAVPDLDVTKDELQLIGVTAMFIAGKFEEVYPPELEDYIYIADNSCNKEQILEAEMMMTNALNFDFTRPSPVHFLRRCCKAAEASTEEYCTAKYIAELSILSMSFVAILPSLTSAAAMYLTLKMHRPYDEAPLWSSVMQYYGGHTEKEILPIAAKLLELIKTAPTLKHQVRLDENCIYKKYNNKKLCEVAGFATQCAEHMVLPTL